MGWLSNLFQWENEALQRGQEAGKEGQAEMNQRDRSDIAIYKNGPWAQMSKADQKRAEQLFKEGQKQTKK